MYFKIKSLSLRNKLALLLFFLVLMATSAGEILTINLIPHFFEMSANTIAISNLLTRIVYPFLIINGLIGLSGALYLTGQIKWFTHNLKIEEATRLIEERTAIIQKAEEGIIAIDKEKRITIANEETKRVLEKGDEIIGRPIDEILENPFLPGVLESGLPVFNQERLLNNTIVICNRLPIVVRGEIIGAVTIFRRKAEIHRLAEELTGIKTFIEIQRAQNHEYKNKLHAIAGLIQLNKPDQALNYIFEILKEQQEITSFLTNNICDYNIISLLLGKYSQAKELKVNLAIDRYSRLDSFPVYLDRGALTVILGNLLENALDAASEMEPPRRKVYFAMFDLPTAFTIKVQDLGKGIPDYVKKQIFEQGFTTKGEGRGIGLYLVKKHVNTAGGSISVDSSPEEGTTVTVTIPKKPLGLK